jgi:hypothetical protein
MERTQAVERIIAALAPAVGAEIDKTLGEAERKLEEECQSRLEAATREAQTEARQSFAGELARAAQEAGETARRELMVVLEPRIRQQVEEARRDARERAVADMEAIQAVSKPAPVTSPAQPTESADSAEDRDRLQVQLAEWRLLAGAELRMAEADTQLEMLVRFMKLASSFAESIAIYVTRGEALTLWKARGPKTFPSSMSAATVGADHYFRVISARGRTVAAVAAAPKTRGDALDFLAGCLERSIILLGVKLLNPAQSAQSPAAAAGAAIHEDARKTARTLISEIASNHELEVIHGRVKSDIYTRLRGEIEDARRQYLERVPCAIAASRDYFDEELVRGLAENKPALMGAGFPGAGD